MSVSGYSGSKEAVIGHVLNVENTAVPVREKEYVAVTGSKIWEDENDLDQIRPESITIRVMANGEEVRSAEINAEDNWEWNFEMLPKYDEDGQMIIYTITEDEVDGYESRVAGFDVTNTHVPETEAESEPETEGNSPESPESESEESVQTSDETPLPAMIALMLMAMMLGLSGYVYRRRRIYR